MQSIIFEQPLNEITRVNLRLEYLFKKIDHCIDCTAYWSVRAKVESIVQIIHILDRPDIKGKYTKALHQQLSVLRKAHEHHHADQEKISEWIRIFERLLSDLNHTGEKLGQKLREKQFINRIRQQLLFPGGEADFELPAYQCWLNLQNHELDDHMSVLYAELNLVKEIVSHLLMMSRGSGRTQKHIAQHGFYQLSVDPKNAIQLIQISMTDQMSVYPVISAGKHRVCIRFYDGTELETEEQVTSDVAFSLKCCS